MTEPKFDFWKPTEKPINAFSTGENKPKKREVVGSSEAQIAAKRESIVRNSVRKLAIEKNISYGTTQEFFSRPENADKKSILEYRLGIDLDQYPINSDVFMSALADFQQIHHDAIGYDPDGWFADISGRGPTPTWRTMFDGFVIPDKSTKKRKDTQEKTEKNQYRGIDIPRGLSPEKMTEWTQDVDALWLIDGLKNVSYDRDKNQFVYIPTKEFIHRDHLKNMGPEYRRGFMLDWVGDRNAKRLISQSGTQLLPGLGYNDVQNVYTYQGQELPRDYQSVETLRNWQNEIVPRYIVATLGGEKLREFYTAWESAPNKYSFSGLINKFWPGVPFPTKADVQDASAGKHDPLHGVPPTDEQFRLIFEKIQLNGGYPSSELLQSPPQIIESGSVVNDGLFLSLLSGKAPSTLRAYPLPPSNEYAKQLHAFALPITEARFMMAKIGVLNVADFAGDSLPLQNILHRLVSYQAQAKTAQEKLRWNWDTKGLNGIDVWNYDLQREVEIVSTLLKQVESVGMQKQDNLQWTEKQILKLKEDLLTEVVRAVDTSDLKKQPEVQEALKKVSQESDLYKKIPLIIDALKLVNTGFFGNIADMFSDLPTLIEKLEHVNSQPNLNQSIDDLLASVKIIQNYHSEKSARNIGSKLSKYQTEFGFYSGILKNQLPSVTQVREAYRLSDDSDGRGDDRLFKKVPFTVPISIIQRIMNAAVKSDAPMTLPPGNPTSSPEDIVSDEISTYVNFSQDTLPTSIHIPTAQYNPFLIMLQKMTSQPLTYPEHADNIANTVGDPAKTILENILFNFITLPPNP